MDRKKSEFAHSLRGALNALKLCVSALEMPMDPSEKLEFVADIESSADRIAALIAERESALMLEASAEARKNAARLVLNAIFPFSNSTRPPSPSMTHGASALRAAPQNGRQDG